MDVHRRGTQGPRCAQHRTRRRRTRGARLVDDSSGDARGLRAHAARGLRPRGRLSLSGRKPLGSDTRRNARARHACRRSRPDRLPAARGGDGRATRSAAVRGSIGRACRRAQDLGSRGLDDRALELSRSGGRRMSVLAALGRSASPRHAPRLGARRGHLRRRGGRVWEFQRGCDRRRGRSRPRLRSGSSTRAACSRRNMPRCGRWRSCR